MDPGSRGLTTPDTGDRGPQHAPPSGTSGLDLFARYAYPPNRRGYCGPADHEALLAYARGGAVDQRLARLAQAFDGPLPYLRTLAGPDGDPFSAEVVRTYWIGGPLLETVDRERFGRQLEATFRGQPTVDWDRVAAALPHGVPHHSFHVLVTYPWLGLLDRPGGAAIGVLDRCLIRWGQVQAIGTGTATVRTRRLVHRDGLLGFGAEEVEEVTTLAADGPDALAPGDDVALHWGWICGGLGRDELTVLREQTTQQVEMVNRVLLRSG